MYSALAVAHANIWLNEWAQQNGMSNVKTPNLDQMKTLNNNIQIILEENRENKSVLVNKDKLIFLKESIEQGRLANEQFNALESIIIND